MKIGTDAWIVAVVLCAALIGCATTLMETGKPIDEASVANIVKGKTTKTEVRQLLGDPSSTTMSGGFEIWGYQYTKITRERGAGSITLALLGAGSAGAKDDTQTQSLSVSFKDNVVADVTYTKAGSASQLGGTTR